MRRKCLMRPRTQQPHTKGIIHTERTKETIDSNENKTMDFMLFWAQNDQSLPVHLFGTWMHFSDSHCMMHACTPFIQFVQCVLYLYGFGFLMVNITNHMPCRSNESICHSSYNTVHHAVRTVYRMHSFSIGNGIKYFIWPPKSKSESCLTLAHRTIAD